MTAAPLNSYGSVIGSHNLEELKLLSRKVQGRRMHHINSTAIGGGVAEILNRLIPLLNQLGMAARWDVIKGGTEFFEVTKRFHNALHGRAVEVEPRMFELFYEHTRRNARELDFSEDDLVVIHDPQPVGLVNFRKAYRNCWIWRCHLDLSHPEQRVWNFLKRFVVRYDACIFSAPNFAQTLMIPQFMIPPSIDPLSDKNRELEPEEIRRVLERYGIDPDRPLIVQISRFDRLKDPVGVIEAYKLVKRYHDCQLVLAGGTAADDPEALAVLDEVRAARGDDPDCFILVLPPSDLEVNALQRAATIVVQKSLGEGFGLVVAEALWKRRPAIATAVGGIPLQIQHEVTGILVHSIEGMAYYIRYLLTHPDLARKLGEYGHLHILHNFLITSHLRRWLLLLIALDHPGERIIYP